MVSVNECALINELGGTDAFRTPYNPRAFPAYTRGYKILSMSLGNTECVADWKNKKVYSHEYISIENSIGFIHEPRCSRPLYGVGDALADVQVYRFFENEGISKKKCRRIVLVDKKKKTT